MFCSHCYKRFDSHWTELNKFLVCYVNWSSTRKMRPYLKSSGTHGERCRINDDNVSSKLMIHITQGIKITSVFYGISIVLF